MRGMGCVMMVERRVEIGGVIQTVIGPAGASTRQMQWDEAVREQRVASGVHDKRDFTAKTVGATGAGSAWGERLGGQ